MRRVRHTKNATTSDAQTPYANVFAPAANKLLPTTSQSIKPLAQAVIRTPPVTADVDYDDDSGYSCTDISTTINQLTPAYNEAKATVEDEIDDANLSGASIVLNPDGTLTINGVGGYTTEFPDTLGDWVNLGEFEADYADMSAQLLQLNILTTLYGADGCWSQPLDPPLDPNQYGYEGSYTSDDGSQDGAGGGVTCYYVDWYDADGTYLYTDNYGCYENQD